MPVETALSHGVMEGKGSYNKHAAIPAAGSALALPMLEKAVRSVEAGPGDDPL